MITQPVFARPPSRIIRFSSKADYVEFLKQHNIPFEEWGEKGLSKAWQEVVEGDAVYCTDHNFIKTAYTPVVRCICVIAVRVTVSHPRLGTLVLVEFVREGDFYRPRRQADSSLSEKIILDPATGRIAETPVETIARCLEQETSIVVPLNELTLDAVTFMPRTEKHELLPIGFGAGSSGVEQDFGPTQKYVGIETHRQVAHYTAELRRRHYRPQGHQDPATRYFSSWHSASAKGGLVPLSVESVRNMKRASA